MKQVIVTALVTFAWISLILLMLPVIVHYLPWVLYPVDLFGKWIMYWR